MFKTIKIEHKDKTAILILNRPKVHNAFNEVMIKEITVFLKEIDEEKTDLIIIKGNGKSFSSGADLNWMKDIVNFTFDENISDSKYLSDMFETIYNLNIPVISIAHGNVFGGALGIIAISDFVLAEKETKFSFSEAKLGLIPAVISPYVMLKIGNNNSKKLFITGEIFNSKKAKKIGLIDRVYKADYHKELNNLIESIKTSSKESIMSVKKLMRKFSTSRIDENIKKYTIEEIARLRSSEDAQKRIMNFLNKKL